MPSYQPTSRRPIADIFRLTAARTTQYCAGHDISPDAISCFSVFAAALAAVCLWKSGQYPVFLVFAPAFCYLRLWCNMLDGMVALAAGKASWRGEIFNDLPDRVSDVVIFAGVAHSGLMNPTYGYWAAILAVLTAYVGMFGQAVGGQREFGGVMSKPWRMVVVHLGAWITAACIWWNNGVIRFVGLTVFDWTCLIVIVGCLQTIIVRLKRIMATLQARSAAN